MTKIMKKGAVILLIAILAVPATIVLPKNTQVVQAAKQMRLSKTAITVNVGKSKTLKVKNTKKKVKWFSSNKKIVKVSSKGKVTGVKAGSAYIYARVGKKKLSCFVIVKSKAKLSSSKLALKIAQSKTLTVKNTKNKVKWLSLDPGIAKVTSKGKVTGVSEGKTTIVAKVEGVKLYCAVTVALPVEEAKKKISITCERSDSEICVVAIVKNSNAFPLTINGTMVFYDSSGNVLSKEQGSLMCVGSAETGIMQFIYPYDSDDDPIIPASYKMTYKLESCPFDSYVSKINTSFRRGTNGFVASLTNTSRKDLVSQAVCLMYDDQGELIGYEWYWFTNLDAGSTEAHKFKYPFDDYHNQLTPANAKLYIFETYSE